MNNVEKIITESYAKGGPQAVEEAARHLLEMDLRAGDAVAVVDDPAWPLQGVKGRVVGASNKGTGYTDVETPNGIVVPCQTSLLIKVNESLVECVCEACGSKNAVERKGKTVCAQCGQPVA
jgi:hypothetical protein